MLQKNHNGAPYFEFQIFQEFRGGLRHAVLSRHIPMNPREQWNEIFETEADAASFETQLHGTQTWLVENADDAESESARRQGDVLITSITDVPLMIRIADCASVLLFDPVHKVIANIHAGWRGIAQKVIHQTLKLLETRFGSERGEIRAAISPMLGSCCSHFSDPKRELPEFMHKFIVRNKRGVGLVGPTPSEPREGGESERSEASSWGNRRFPQNNHVDLWAAVENQLLESGVREENYENPRLCTLCHPEFFYSNRRNGESGRFGTLIMLK